MASVNKVLLIGHVGKDPEIREVGDGKVASFTLATSERYRDRNGEQRENTEWHNIVVWGQSADFVANYIIKGDLLYVEGSIHTRTFMGNDGVKRYTTEIKADVVRSLGNKPQQSAPQPHPAQRQAPAYNQAPRGYQQPQQARQPQYQPQPAASQPMFDENGNMVDDFPADDAPNPGPANYGRYGSR